jgi:hypothetical protein
MADELWCGWTIQPVLQSSKTYCVFKACCRRELFPKRFCVSAELLFELGTPTQQENLEKKMQRLFEFNLSPQSFEVHCRPFIFPHTVEEWLRGLPPSVIIASQQQKKVLTVPHPHRGVAFSGVELKEHPCVLSGSETALYTAVCMSWPTNGPSNILYCTRSVLNSLRGKPYRSPAVGGPRQKLKGGGLCPCFALDIYAPRMARMILKLYTVIRSCLYITKLRYTISISFMIIYSWKTVHLTRLSIYLERLFISWKIKILYIS